MKYDAINPDDSLAMQQARMSKPLRSDRITLVVYHRNPDGLRFWNSRIAEAFVCCEGFSIAKGEDEDDVLVTAYLDGVEAGKKIAMRGQGDKDSVKFSCKKT